MSALRKALSASFVPLREAVFCCQCEIISENNTPYCLACGSGAVLNLCRTLGGSLRGSNSARVVTDTELNNLVRELIATVPSALKEPLASLRSASGSLRRHRRTSSSPYLQDSLLHRTDLDLAEFGLEPTINLIAERAQTITAATGAAVALRRGNEIVCRARTGRTAPDLGVRLQTNSGLSAQAVRTGEVLL